MELIFVISVNFVTIQSVLFQDVWRTLYGFQIKLTLYKCKCTNNRPTKHFIPYIHSSDTKRKLIGRSVFPERNISTAGPGIRGQLTEENAPREQEQGKLSNFAF